MSTSAEAAPNPWVVSPAFDIPFMFSAIWGAILLAGGSQLALLSAATLLAANRTIALAHSWSTTFMVLFSPVLKEERRDNLVRYRIIPAAIVLVSLLLGLSVGRAFGAPEAGALVPHPAAWVLFLGLFWVGHFWHFGAQDFGVLSLYRQKAGQTKPIDRRIDKTATSILMFVVHPIVYLHVLTTSPLTETFFNLAPWAEALIHGLARWTLIVVAASGIFCLTNELRRENRSTPKILYYLVIHSHAPILYFADFGLIPYYIVTYLWSHWLIAVGLVSKINVNSYRREGDALVRAIARHAMLLGVIILAVKLLTDPYDRLNLFSSVHYERALQSIPPDGALIAGLFLAFFLAEQLLHYYCDRCLFRFRDPRIRQKIGALV